MKNVLIVAVLGLALAITAVAALAADAAPAAPAGKPLAKGEVKVDGMKVTVHGQGLDVEPLPVLHSKCDTTLDLAKPGWSTKAGRLPGGWFFRSLRPGSLVVTLADQPNTKLVEGTDYVVNYNWSAVAALAGGKVPAGGKVHCEFDYTASRLDLVEQSPEGKFLLKKGQEDRGVPMLPEVTPGHRAVLGIYLPQNTAKLTMDNINIIDAAATAVPPVSNGESLAGVRAKLAAGKPVTIAFIGDSITAQGKDLKDGGFVDRFAKYLEQKYPDTKLVVTPKETVVEPQDKQTVVVKAGIGGNNSADGLKRIDKDVIAHKPDVVVIMFGVNDENRKGETSANVVPVPAYKKNLAAMVDKVQAAGAAPILMTTSMKNLGWEHTVGNLNEYAAAAREVAREKKCCLVDNFKSWEELPKRGYNYMIYLGTCINHPVELGHALFLENLRAAFEGSAGGEKKSR